MGASRSLREVSGATLIGGLRERESGFSLIDGIARNESVLSTRVCADKEAASTSKISRNKNILEGLDTGSQDHFKCGLLIHILDLAHFYRVKTTGPEDCPLSNQASIFSARLPSVDFEHLMFVYWVVVKVDASNGCLPSLR